MNNTVNELTQLLETGLAAYIEKQAPGQAGLILAGLNVLVPALIHTHTAAQEDTPRTVSLTYNPNAPDPHTVTAQYQPQTTQYQPQTLPLSPNTNLVQGETP